VREVGASGILYMSGGALAQAAGRPGTANILRLRLSDRGPASQRLATAAVEAALVRAGAALYAVTPAPAYRAALGDHILILIRSLAFVGGLMAVVGGLGLAATMSVTVLERTREIGVLQAIGASPRLVLRLVATEGLAIGALSFAAALAGSFPLTWLIDDAMGRIFFAVPLTPAWAPWAVLAWLALVAATAAAASLLPAWRASRLAVAAALQYE
jgi:putative ABC transport system permease protein